MAEPSAFTTRTILRCFVSVTTVKLINLVEYLDLHGLCQAFRVCQHFSLLCMKVGDELLTLRKQWFCLLNLCKFRLFRRITCC